MVGLMTPAILKLAVGITQLLLMEELNTRLVHEYRSIGTVTSPISQAQFVLKE